MKLKTTETPIMSGGNLKMKGFQIAASAKAFRILSSSLYKNKIRAIVRELACNAVDGHIANGNKGSFDVTLPGMLDPQFKIRDYGCGMDDDTIMNLYTTYFASTKSDSNDFIGALGLGSKSPFSYTDSFTVVSYHGGMRRAYSAFIKDGEPTITKVSEAESDEPTGIEITVPVNPKDSNSWRDEARYVFSSFGEIKPNVAGHEYDFLPSDKTEFQKKNTVHGAGVFAIMGNIVYPLPAEFWKTSMINLFMEGQSSWNNREAMSYYIRFELGEIDITPSREELSLDEDTVAAIKKRMDGTNERLSETLMKEVKTFDSVRKLRTDILKRYNHSYWKHISTHNNFVLSTGVAVPNEIYSVTSFVCPTRDVVDSKGAKVKENITLTRYDMSLASPRLRKIDTWSHQRIAELGNNDKVYLFVNDMKTGHVRTMTGLKNLGKLPKNGYVWFIQQEHADALIKSMQKCWKGDELEIFYSSKCDDARKSLPTQPKVRTKKAPNTVMVSATDTTPVALYSEDIKKLSGVWIPMFQNEYVSTKARGRKSCSLATIRQYMELRGIKEIPVIKSSHWEQVGKNANMTEIWDDLVKLVIEKKDELKEGIFAYNNSQNSVIMALRRNKITAPIADKLSNVTKDTEIRHLFDDVLNNIDYFRHLPTVQNNVKLLADMSTLYVKLRDQVREKGDKVLNDFNKQNPLISFYLARSYGTISDEIANEFVRIVKL